MPGFGRLFFLPKSLLLTGELQKGRTYYRCHSKSCGGTSLREDEIDAEIRELLAGLQMSESERIHFEPQIAEDDQRLEDANRALMSRLSKKERKLLDQKERLTDALIDRVIDNETFKQRSNRLLLQINDIRQEITANDAETNRIRKELKKFFELWKSLYSSYNSGNSAEKREIIKSVTSNLWVAGKNLEFELREPFRTIIPSGNFDLMC